MNPVTMEQCLNRAAISLWNYLLPEEKQVVYQSRRVGEDGKTVFLVDQSHMEAYAADGTVLMNVDLDAQNRISGWMKSEDYVGYYKDGQRHGEGTELSDELWHAGDKKRSGRWEQGIFVSGTLYQTIQCKNVSAEDEYIYEYEKDKGGEPLQLCSGEYVADELIQKRMPDDCQKLYVADMTLQNNEYSVVGEPKPLCPLLGGEMQIACLDCDRYYEKT